MIRRGFQLKQNSHCWLILFLTKATCITRMRVRLLRASAHMHQSRVTSAKYRYHQL